MGAFKLRFKWELAQHAVTVTEQQHLVDLVSRVANETPADICAKMETSNRAYVLQILHAIRQGVDL